MKNRLLTALVVVLASGLWGAALAGVGMMALNI